MEPKKHKNKNSYTIMIVSDSSVGGIKQFTIGSRVASLLLTLVILIFVVVAGYGVYGSYTMEELTKRNAYLSGKNTELTDKNSALEVEKAELTDKVAILSTTVNNKVEKEEAEASKYLPTGFPLGATATIDEQNIVDENGQPILHFVATKGTNVVAAGNGAVIAIEPDAIYGNILKIDHGNGYVTIYRNISPCKVKVGDEVTRGITLFEMVNDNEILGYQIIKDDAYIAPLEMMEVYG